MELINDGNNHEWEFQYDSVEKTLKAGFYDENGKLELKYEVYEVESEKMYFALELIARYYYVWDDGFGASVKDILEDPCYYDGVSCPKYHYSEEFINTPLREKEEEMRKELHLNVSYKQAISEKREREKREEKLKQELGDNYLPF